EGVVGPDDGLERDLPLGGARLVGGDGEHEPRVAEGTQAFDDAGQEADVVGVERAHHRAELGVAVEVDERPVAVDEGAPAPRSAANASDAAGPSAFTSWSKRSQMRWWKTSWKPSTCGVEVCPLAARGTMTLASAMVRRAPPS